MVLIFGAGGACDSKVFGRSSARERRCAASSVARPKWPWLLPQGLVKYSKMTCVISTQSIKNEPQLDTSLYTLFQILSVSAFENNRAFIHPAA